MWALWSNDIEVLQHCHADFWVPDVWIVMAICLILNFCCRARLNWWRKWKTEGQARVVPHKFWRWWSRTKLKSCYCFRDSMPLDVDWTSTGRDSVRSDLVWLFGAGGGESIVCVCEYLEGPCCAFHLWALPLVLGYRVQFTRALTNLFGAENKRLQKVDQ